MAASRRQHYELSKLSERTFEMDAAVRCALTKESPSLASKLCNELIDAAENNDLKAIQHLLDVHRVPIYWANANRQTAAHIAVGNNNLVLLEYLLKKNAAALVGAEDNRHRTPLHFAAALGNLHLVIFLVEKCKLPPNLVNTLEVSVLYMAAVHGEYRTLVYLVERGADVNIGTFSNDTPLHAAARTRHLKIVRYLVEEGNADVNARNLTGDTALHEAVRAKHADMVEYLIEECRASPLLENAEGENALYIAVYEECEQIIEYICNLSWYRDLIRAYVDDIPESLRRKEKEVANKKRDEKAGGKNARRVNSKREGDERGDIEEEIERRRLETKLVDRTSAKRDSMREDKFGRHLRALQSTMNRRGKGIDDASTKFNPLFSAERSLTDANVAGPSRIYENVRSRHYAHQHAYNNSEENLIKSKRSIFGTFSHF